MSEEKDETLVEESLENEEVKVEVVLEPDEELEELSAEEQLQQQLDEKEDQYLRLLADYNNYKRRVKLDEEAARKYRAQSVINELIPVLDNFGLALSVESQSEEAQKMMEGMQMIYRSLVTALESEGLTMIEAADQPFDPNFHQAVMTASEEGVEPGIVLEELQKGYALKDRVLRPAMVKVSE